MNRFFDAWCKYGINPRIIEAARTFRPTGASESRLAEQDVAAAGGPERGRGIGEDVFLVLPFHPLLEKARLNSVCAATARAWSSELHAPRVRNAWRNGGPPLHIRLRKLGLETQELQT